MLDRIKSILLITLVFPVALLLACSAAGPSPGAMRTATPDHGQPAPTQASSSILIAYTPDDPIDITYEVQEGDTLSGIAERFHVRMDEIVSANNLADPGHVEVGQRLLIPQSGDHQAATTPVPMPTVAQASQLARIPILMYHHVRELPEGADAIERGLTVLPANFRDQMAFLQSRGYVAVSLHDLVDAAAGKKILPPKPIVLTFDDGYTDAYTDVFPILKDHGFTGTFYLLSGSVGYPEYINWEQAKEMSGAGMDMEAHGIAHLDLTQMSVDDARQQITASKTEIESRLGKPVTSYCYPSGKYNATTLDLVRAAGYLDAVTTKPGIAGLDSALLELSRVRVQGSMDINGFAAAIGETP